MKACRFVSHQGVSSTNETATAFSTPSSPSRIPLSKMATMRSDSVLLPLSNASIAKSRTRATNGWSSSSSLSAKCSSRIGWTAGTASTSARTTSSFVKATRPLCRLASRHGQRERMIGAGRPLPWRPRRPPVPARPSGTSERLGPPLVGSLIRYWKSSAHALSSVSKNASPGGRWCPSRVSAAPPVAGDEALSPRWPVPGAVRQAGTPAIEPAASRAATPGTMMRQ